MWIARIGCCFAAAVMIAVPVIGSGTAWASPSAQPGSVLWTNKQDGTVDGVATSPDGSQVFVTGGSSGSFTTIALNAATGQQQWDKSYGGPSSGTQAVAVAVSPDGHTVFVTGGDSGAYATVAYDAATGDQLWASRYNGHASPLALAVSPDGGTVFVTGTSKAKKSGSDYATVAYQASTGKQLWASRYNGRANAGDFANALAVSPDGSAVYVTGESKGRTSGDDAATVAYQAATGKQLWASRYNNARANGTDVGYSVAVSQDGRHVFVTGQSEGARSHADMFTAAYGATRGTPLWTSRLNGKANLDDAGVKVLVSPLDGTVITCGTSRAQTDDYTAIAYNPVTGAAKWTASYNGSGHQNTLGTAALSPDGSTLYLYGTATEFFGGGGVNTFGFTTAVNAATGAQGWGALATISDGTDAFAAAAIAVNPDGSAVYTGLNSFGVGKFETFAFQA